MESNTEVESSDGVSLFSIKSLKVKKESERIRGDNNSSEVNEEFTELDFFNAWDALRDKALEDGHKLLFSSTDNQPELKGVEFTIPLNSEISKGEVQQKKEYILSFLRERLKNDSLDFKVRVIDKFLVEQVETDKYKILLKKNPLLEELRTELDLDLSY